MTARAVGERTRELGVRLALGATPSGVLRLVVRQALGSVVAGLLAGVALAGVAVTMLRSTLTGLEHAATWTAAPAVALLAVVAFVAAVVPARRVIATDPTRALQVE
jgi:ABC-type antimicrobial peptide transport system permease subunit